MTTQSGMARLRPIAMPALGIGTYQLSGEVCAEAVCSALKMGYRLVDTAASYRNETFVGRGIAQSGVPRDELFVVVKINLKAMASESAIRSSIEQSIEQLGIGYADCAIMHWPACAGLRQEDAQGNPAARVRCWKVMQELQQEGKVRYMGVSNFLERHFAQIPTPEPRPGGDHDAVIPPFAYPFPVLNQIELHPLCVQADLVRFCQQRGIVLQQYAPLAQGNSALFQHPALLALQQKHFRQYSVSDIILMWGLSQGFCALVRSSSEAHLRQNLEAGLTYFGTTTTSPQGTRPPLTDLQRGIIQNLREHLGMDESTPDTHFFWYSSRVA